ncbi:response regulator transcription factor, partial [Streptomyces phaeoluteigriseus]|uniref:response regulator transcription factor n=1 Tax=Streptomyces phaeoluteigriseus TaxID=114686 RepID=UPI00117DA4F6
MGVRVLLIEDDQTIAEPLVEGLGHFGLAVRHVRTGTEGLRGPYGDVVLLDLGLPDVDGIDVCRGIRRTSDVPLIILSARGEEADRVLGLELGADDYLAKPFSMRELVARVRAVTRRTQRGAGGAGTGGAAEAGRAWGAEFDGEAFTGIAAPGP